MFVLKETNKQKPKTTKTNKQKTCLYFHFLCIIFRNPTVNSDNDLVIYFSHGPFFILPVSRSLPGTISSFIPRDLNLINYTEIHDMHPMIKSLDLDKGTGKDLA